MCESSGLGFSGPAHSDGCLEIPRLTQQCCVEAALYGTSHSSDCQSCQGPTRQKKKKKKFSVIFGQKKGKKRQKTTCAPNPKFPRWAKYSALQRKAVKEAGAKAADEEAAGDIAAKEAEANAVDEESAGDIAAKEAEARAGDDKAAKEAEAKAGDDEAGKAGKTLRGGKTKHATKQSKSFFGSSFESDDDGHIHVSNRALERIAGNTMSPPVVGSFLMVALAATKPVQVQADDGEPGEPDAVQPKACGLI